MKRFFPLAALVLLALPLVAAAQAPPTSAQIDSLQSKITQLQAELNAIKAPCPCGKTAIVGITDDQADMLEAVARGFGSRLAIGPYREATLAVRQWKLGLVANDSDGLTKLQTLLGRGKLTPCQKATLAVIGLEMVNAFSPGTIPPQVLAMAIQLQQAACNPPVPPTPTKAVKIPPLAPPVVHVIAPLTHARGLKLPADQAAKHANRAKLHAAQINLWSRVKASDLPATYDCRQYCTPVKDQGQCGSCWDFSGVEVAEAALIKAGVLTTAASSALSTQFILDGCAGSNGGCNGDDNTTVLSAAKGGGLPLESLYGPYYASERRCHWTTNPGQLYTIKDWGYVGPTEGVPSVTAIKAAIMQYGFLGCAVAADSSWDSYTGGVMKGGGRNIDHDVGIAGWDDAKNAWLVRNSWGPGWGENGYCWIDYDSYQIGYEAVWNVAGDQPIPPPTPPTPPVPPTPPTPPGPTPTRHGIDVAAALVAQYQEGDAADKAEVLSIIEKAKAVNEKYKAKRAKQLQLAP